ncbi:hypothetical protein JVT61DRAFT_12037 [Boletus reticuloceps]|uniref:Uncharacterized protein n=1 Tax=Boletus reticuloceps TaxID=495285 RepID=A0A8I2YEL3_9AGAM|nr:hypothetical protein JVT61DRAFT_12037 [Boletus reticuloceps]
MLLRSTKPTITRSCAPFSTKVGYMCNFQTFDETPPPKEPRFWSPGMVSPEHSPAHVETSAMPATLSKKCTPFARRTPTCRKTMRFQTTPQRLLSLHPSLLPKPSIKSLPAQNAAKKTLNQAPPPITLDAPFDNPYPAVDTAAISLCKPDTPAVPPPNSSALEGPSQHPLVITLPGVEMDIDLEAEETSEDFDIDLTACPSSTATSPTAEPSITQDLFLLGLRVDSRFQLTICLECRLLINFAFTHAHLVRNHKSPCFVYPPKQTQKDMLLALHADKVKSVFPGLISLIPGLAVINAIKCTAQSCPAVVVFPTCKRFYKHCQKDHPSIPKKQLSWSSTKDHQLAKYRANRQMVEVCSSPSSPSSPCIADILQHSKTVQLYALPETFKLPANARILPKLDGRISLTASTFRTSGLL